MFSPDFIADIAPRLGGFFLVVCAMNVVAGGYAWRRLRRSGWAVLWWIVAAGFGLLAVAAFRGTPLLLPERVKDAIDWLFGPVTVTLGCYTALVVFYVGRRFFVRPVVALGLLNAALLAFGLALTDSDFARVVTAPDNLAVVGMVFLLAFFVWLAAAQAVRNDRRAACGVPPVEKKYDQKVFVWPDLVYVELIALVLVTVGLIVWSMAVSAPLEQPANPVVTPNPSKAPWYFVGLQELLVFSDAWNVGVVVPCLIIVGLMAIPYLDRNPQGNGYYTIDQRPFAYTTFMFGFLGLWVLLILVGTLMRGPNWNFFGPFAPRDPHLLTAQHNVKLSEYFWTVWLGRPVPEVPNAAGAMGRLAAVVWRELPGLVLLGLYFVVLPIVLGRTALRGLRQQMGCGRYWIMILLWLFMLTLPLKMILHWSWNVSYVVSMPEYLLNL